MTVLTDKATLAPSSAELAFVWLQRAVALYCLMFGVLYWIRLVGFYPGNLWRFDLMPVYWQVASVALAVFFPFAAIGLWMTASWGVVVWVICAIAETIMYIGYPELFGRRLPIVASHIVTLGLYLGFWIWLRRQRRKAEPEIR